MACVRSRVAMSVDYCDMDVLSFRSENRSSWDTGKDYAIPEDYPDFDDTPWHLSLLMEQRADGSFPMTPGLLSAARLTSDEAEALMRKSGLDEAAFATALAIAVLRKHAATEHATWGAAVSKAVAWLDTRGLRVEDKHPVDWLLESIG